MIGWMFRALDRAGDRLDRGPASTPPRVHSDLSSTGSVEERQIPSTSTGNPEQPLRYFFKKCPRCVERVKRDAQVCKHCSYEFTEADEALVLKEEIQETKAVHGCQGFAVLVMIVLFLIAVL